MRKKTNFYFCSTSIGLIIVLLAVGCDESTSRDDLLKCQVDARMQVVIGSSNYSIKGDLLNTGETSVWRIRIPYTVYFADNTSDSRTAIIQSTSLEIGEEKSYVFSIDPPNQNPSSTMYIDIGNKTVQRVVYSTPIATASDLNVETNKDGSRIIEEPQNQYIVFRVTCDNFDTGVVVGVKIYERETQQVVDEGTTNSDGQYCSVQLNSQEWYKIQIYELPGDICISWIRDVSIYNSAQLWYPECTEVDLGIHMGGDCSGWGETWGCW